MSDENLQHTGGNNSALKRTADGREVLSSYLDEGEEYVTRDEDKIRANTEASNTGEREKQSKSAPSTAPSSGKPSVASTE